MAVGRKYDCHPLLAPGRHVMTLPQIKSRFVDTFPNNLKRKTLFATFEEFVSEYISANIVCEIWVDGSFLTEKQEPDDFDIAVIISHEVGQLLSPEQRDLVDKTNEDNYLENLHTFSFIRRSKDDPLYGDECVDGAHTWHEQWGIEHSGQWIKGFAVIKLGETDVGLRICC